MALAAIQIGGLVLSVLGNARNDGAASPRKQASAASATPGIGGIALPGTPVTATATSFGQAHLAPSPPPLAPPAAMAAPQSQPTAFAVTFATDQGTQIVTLTVQPGESLSSIAAVMGVSPAALAAANGLAPTAWLAVGQALQILAPTLRLK